MRKERIAYKDAKDVWRKLGDNEYIKTLFPTFMHYWEDCQRMNRLPEEEWQDFVEINKKKLVQLKNEIQN